MKVIPIKANGAIKGYPNTEIYNAKLFDVGDNLFFDECDIFKCIEKNNDPTADIPTGAPPEGYAESLASIAHARAYVASYYIDSVSWDGDSSTRNETGSGTIDDPWRNLEFAMEQADAKAECFSNMCCDFFVRLRVKGTVDYTFGDNYYNYDDSMILTPWADVEITSGTGVDDSQPYWTASGTGFRFKGYVMSCRYTVTGLGRIYELYAGMMYNCTFKGVANSRMRVTSNLYRCHIFTDSMESILGGEFLFNCKITGNDVVDVNASNTYIYNCIMDVSQGVGGLFATYLMWSTVVYNSSISASSPGGMAGINASIVLSSTVSLVAGTTYECKTFGITVRRLVHGCSVTCSSTSYSSYTDHDPHYDWIRAISHSFGIELNKYEYTHSDADTVGTNNIINVSSSASIDFPSSYTGYWEWEEGECDVWDQEGVCTNCRHAYLSSTTPGGVVQDRC